VCRLNQTFSTRLLRNKIFQSWLITKQDQQKSKANTNTTVTIQQRKKLSKKAKWKIMTQGIGVVCGKL
jgi:ribosomal protein S17